MMVSSPSLVAVRRAARVLRRMAACPSARPFDDHGVPQHSESMFGGTRRVTPARSQSCSKLSCTPGVASVAGPNIVCTQAGKYTACAAVAGAGRRRLAPPPGSSAEYSGTASVPSTARASLFGPATTPAGTCFTALRARPAPLVRTPQLFAATFQIPLSMGPALSWRIFLTRLPVLMFTGQAVWHMPSAAQVSTASYS